MAALRNQVGEATAIQRVIEELCGDTSKEQKRALEQLKQKEQKDHERKKDVDFKKRAGFLVRLGDAQKAWDESEGAADYQSSAVGSSVPSEEQLTARSIELKNADVARSKKRKRRTQEQMKAAGARQCPKCRKYLSKQTYKKHNSHAGPCTTRAAKKQKT